MKKIREKTVKAGVSRYTFCVGVFFLLLMPLARAGEDSGLTFDDLQKAIMSLVNPFVSAVKEPPAPVESGIGSVPDMPKPEPTPKLPVSKFASPPPPPPPPPAPVAPKLDVTGVMIGSERSLAVINGEVVQAGQTFTVEGEKVVLSRIEKKRLHILYKGVVFKISIERED